MATRRVPRSVLVTVVLAAVVTVAALVAVVSIRVRENGPQAAEVAAPTPAQQQAGPDCGESPCRVVAVRNVQGADVQLLADADGANGRFVPGDGTVVETTITELGAKLTPDSLSCVTATVSACLVSASLNGGKIAQLVVARDGDWRSVDKPYFSDAGVIVLGNVTGTDDPEVTVVDSDPALARVYALDGSVAGCTKRYSYPAQIRGWPKVQLLASDLRACPA